LRWAVPLILICLSVAAFLEFSKQYSNTPTAPRVLDTMRDIVKRALAADPKHLKSLALAGSEAFDRSDFKAAIDYWKRMKATAPSGSMDAKLADSNIEEAMSRISGSSKPANVSGQPKN
jgi:cytochrome c-type biogenesis protein CcmH/NrfG